MHKKMLLLCAGLFILPALYFAYGEDARSNLVDKEDPISISIIPKPQRVEVNEGRFVLSGDISIYAGPSLLEVTNTLSSKLEQAGATVLQADELSDSTDIQIILNDSLSDESPEAYQLSVNKLGIKIVGASPQGVFYGIQTLLQLMPPDVYSDSRINGSFDIPYVNIEDNPRFEWRGLMIDLSRHFFGKDMLKKTIDWMAVHKLNRLHLHLTDDPGWRIEIDAYPKLTEIGARGNSSNPDGPAQFLSKADIRELVAYASDRFINVVPEIDMPGHGGAAAKAYPEFFDGNITYNMGKEDTYAFVQNILDEIMDLFPSPYIHFGGDELRNHRLEELPEVQAAMKEKGFKTIYELEGYFDRFVSDYIASNGRTPMGWDEVANYDIGNDAIVQWWHGRVPEMRDVAINKGYRVILSPGDHVYLDYPQAVGEPGAPWEGNDNGPNSMELIYNWQMIPENYTQQQEQQIIGIETALWTEFIRSEDYYEYMMFPRLAAVAEIAWVAKDDRDMKAFEQRLEKQYRRYEAMGINYRIPVPGDSLGKNTGQYLTN